MFKEVLKKAFHSTLEALEVNPPVFDSESQRGSREPDYITVNNKRVRVVKQLDEGGFSFVYKVVDDSTFTNYALKRLLIQSSDQKRTVENEISIMEEIKGHENIIGYYGSETVPMEGGSTVYILMELGECSVLDIMNNYMKKGRKFSEKEALSIFYDCCLAIMHLHSRKTPIIHRDIKVENMLRVKKKFKLCDFGSCTTMVYDFKKNKRLRSVAKDDLDKNTTVEYRSPEMADLYSGYPINTKSDIWALGCMLYKLLFFKGAFDESGLTIISGSYQIPKNHSYSDKVIRLLKKLLTVNVYKRPNIFDVVKYVSELLGVTVDLKDAPVSKIQDIEKGREFSDNEDGNLMVVKEKKKKKKYKTAKKKKKKAKGLFDMLGDSSSTSKKNNTNSSKTKRNRKIEKVKQQKIQTKTMVSMERNEEQDVSGGDDLFSMLDWKDDGKEKNAGNNQIRKSVNNNTVGNKKKEKDVLQKPLTPDDESNSEDDLILNYEDEEELEFNGKNDLIVVDKKNEKKEKEVEEMNNPFFSDSSLVNSKVKKSSKKKSKKLPKASTPKIKKNELESFWDMDSFDNHSNNSNTKKPKRVKKEKKKEKVSSISKKKEENLFDLVTFEKEEKPKIEIDWNAGLKKNQFFQNQPLGVGNIPRVKSFGEVQGNNFFGNKNRGKALTPSPTNNFPGYGFGFQNGANGNAPIHTPGYYRKKSQIAKNREKNKKQKDPMKDGFSWDL